MKSSLETFVIDEEEKYIQETEFKREPARTIQLNSEELRILREHNLREQNDQAVREYHDKLRKNHPRDIEIRRENELKLIEAANLAFEKKSTRGVITKFYEGFWRRFTRFLASSNRCH